MIKIIKQKRIEKIIHYNYAIIFQFRLIDIILNIARWKGINYNYSKEW